MDSFLYFLSVIIYLAGISIAEGLAQTLTTIVFPPYAWYLFVEHALILMNFIS